MDIQKKKTQIQEEFNKNQQTIQQLIARQEQLKGQYQLLEEEEKPKKEEK